MDRKLIDQAKSYSKKRGKSVSQIVAGFFSLLGAEPDIENSELTPIVRSLKGSLKDANVAKKEYHKYLEEKYL